MTSRSLIGPGFLTIALFFSLSLFTHSLAQGEYGNFEQVFDDFRTDEAAEIASSLDGVWKHLALAQVALRERRPEVLGREIQAIDYQELPTEKRALYFFLRANLEFNRRHPKHSDGRRLAAKLLREARRHPAASRDLALVLILQGGMGEISGDEICSELSLLDIGPDIFPEAMFRLSPDYDRRFLFSSGLARRARAENRDHKANAWELRAAQSLAGGGRRREALMRYQVIVDEARRLGDSYLLKESLRWALFCFQDLGEEEAVC